MKPAPFTYHRPTTLDEALDTLAEVGGDGKVLAGGQSLVPLLSMRLASPGHLVDINRLTELAHVTSGEDGVRLGAIARHVTVEKDDGARRAQPLLGQALAHVAHPTIRNRGTSVGSIVHADPAGELTAVLAVTGGTVTLASKTGTRVVPAHEFFVGPLESSLRHGELAVEAFVPSLAVLAPEPGARMGTAFVEVSRRHGDYAVCGVAAVVGLAPRPDLGSDNSSNGSSDGDSNGSSADDPARVVLARVGYLSMGPTPVVADVTEAAAGLGEGGADLTQADAWLPAADLAAARTEPEPDIHATAAYRLALGRVLAARALAAAAREALDRSARRAA